MAGRPRVSRMAGLRAAPLGRNRGAAGRLSHGGPACSNDSLTEPVESWSWPRKKRDCSTTTSSGPSTSCWASSTRAKAWRPRRSSRSGSASKRCARRWRRPSARPGRPRPARPRSRPAPRRSWSCRCVRRCSSATTTSAPSTCSWAWSARARAWPPRCWSASAPTCRGFASR